MPVSDPRHLLPGPAIPVFPGDFLVQEIQWHLISWPMLRGRPLAAQGKRAPFAPYFRCGWLDRHVYARHLIQIKSDARISACGNHPVAIVKGTDTGRRFAVHGFARPFGQPVRFSRQALMPIKAAPTKSFRLVPLGGTSTPRRITLLPNEGFHARLFATRASRGERTFRKKAARCVRIPAVFPLHLAGK